jgi:hypothetical protein
MATKPIHRRYCEAVEVDKEKHDPCINCAAKNCPYIDCPCPQKREYDENERREIKRVKA